MYWKTCWISFAEDSFTTCPSFILWQSDCKILSSTLAFCKQPFGNFLFLHSQKLCKTNHNIIKLGSSLTFTSMTPFKQRNLPCSRQNTFSITIFALDSLEPKNFHGHPYVPLDILSLRKAKADRRSLQEYKGAQKSHQQQ